MKRILFIALASLMLLGCESSEEAVSTLQENNTVTEEKEMAKTYENPLALWIWQNADGTEEDTAVIRFYKDVAPGHVENFIKLTNENMYNGNLIFRVEPGFVIQTGSPTNENTGGPGYTIDAEFNNIKHLKGTLAMARAMDPNSAGSQYYFALNPLPQLDNKYTVFGQVIENVELLAKVKKGDYVRKVEIVEAKDYYGDDFAQIIESKDIHNQQ